MRNTSYLFLLTGVVLSLSSCRHREVDDKVYMADSTGIVFDYDLEKAAANDSMISISQIVDSVVYIPLEFDILASLRPDYLMTVETDEGFVVSSNSTQGFNGVFQFDKNGRYQKTLVGKGHGHNELVPYFYNWSYNETEKLIVLSGRGYYCELNAETGEVSMLKKSEYAYQTMILVENKRFLALPVEDDPQIPFLVLTDSDGSTVAKYFTKHKKNAYAETPQSGWSPTEHRILDQDKQGRPLFKDMYNDTVYAWSDKGLQPAFCLNAGDLNPKVKDAGKSVRKGQQVFVYHVATVGKYLLCFYHYNGNRAESVFDMETGKLVANERLPIHARGVDLWKTRSPHFVSLDTPTGKRILVGVTWASGDCLYGVVNPSDVSDFLEVDADSNPVLVKMYLN